jgi:hypothetical protein
MDGRVISPLLRDPKAGSISGASCPVAEKISLAYQPGKLQLESGSRGQRG